MSGAPMRDPREWLERAVVCEGCGEIIETEPVPTGDVHEGADRLVPVEECGLCTPDYEEEPA